MSSDKIFARKFTQFLLQYNEVSFSIPNQDLGQSNIMEK